MKQHPSRADGTERAVDALIAAVAAKQSGIISVAQLHALGLSDSEIAWRVRTARLHRVHRGVYAVGHPRITDHAHLVAALLATGPAAFLSYRSAAAVWGLRAVVVREIHVTLTSE